MHRKLNFQNGELGIHLGSTVDLRRALASSVQHQSVSSIYRLIERDIRRYNKPSHTYVYIVPRIVLSREEYKYLFAIFKGKDFDYVIYI